MERKLAAILAADLVGFTALMGRDEAGTLQRMTALRKEVLEPIIAKHRGRLVKLMGDGLLVAFDSVVDAGACALEWQAEVADHQAETAPESALQFRIGVNIGDVIQEGDDIYGDGVNIAARLEALADPGGICLSEDAYRQLRGKVSARYHDQGEERLKNVAEPMRVYRMAGEGENPVPSDDQVSKSGNVELTPPTKPSVAVLPMTAMSEDPDQVFFADGITEDIITELSRIPSLFVIARHSTFQFKGQALDVRRVGNELGVRYVLEGSVRRAGGRVRITVQLIDVEKGAPIWAERYDREMEDIFAVQEDVSRTIAATLTGRVEHERLEWGRGNQAERLAAHDFLLRGKLEIGRYTAEDIKKAKASFEQAIAAAPHDAEGYAWLSLCHSWQYAGWWSAKPEETLSESVALARRAVTMNASIAQAHGSLAYALVYQRELPLAKHHFERNLALMPCDAQNMANYGWCLMFDGEADAGLEWINKGERLNPLQVWWYAWLRGMALYAKGEYQAALTSFDQVPHLPVEVEGWQSAALARLGRQEEAELKTSRFRQRANSEFALDPENAEGGWQHYWLATQPFRRTEDQDHLMEGLRQAGLPI